MEGNRDREAQRQQEAEEDPHQEEEEPHQEEEAAAVQVPDGQDAAVAPNGQDDQAAAAADNDDEEDGQEGGDEANPPNPRMQLSAQEREWALAIKAAIVGDPELDNLPDFFYAHLALIDKEDVQAAVERAGKLQWFWEEYGVVESTQVAMRFLETYVEMLPGVFLSFSWDPDSGKHIVVVDLTKLDNRILTERPGVIVTIMVVNYYINHMLSPDFEAARKGIIVLAECAGFNWRNNFGLEYYTRYDREIVSIYPMNFASVRFFHTGLAWNTLMSMTKQFLPPEVKSKCRVGCISEFGRLDTIYLVPSLEATNKRFLAMARASLEQRYKNVASFSL